MGTSRSAAHRGQKRSHLASLGRGTEFQEAQHPDPEAAVRCTLPGLGRAPVRVVARLNQRREYRAWSEIVGPWTLGCTLSDAELKNVKKHSTENLRQLCAELFLYDWLGQHSEDSRPAMVVRLIKHHAWKNAIQAKIRHGATTTSGNLNQPPAPIQCGATTVGLSVLHGSSVSQVTRSADWRDMIAATPPR